VEDCLLLFLLPLLLLPLLFLLLLGHQQEQQAMTDACNTARVLREALSSCSMNASIRAKKQQQGGRGWQWTFC